MAIGLSWLVLPMACSESTLPASEVGPPSVLLVVLDTVRADHVSSYGHTSPTTPQLDAVARAGVLFEDVTAPASWTWPSHASMFTGTPPWVHGAHTAPLVAGDDASAGVIEHLETRATSMRTDIPTLAEKMEAAGYHAVSLSANPWLTPDLGLTRGFSEAEVFDNDAGVVEAARREIARKSDRPLFLFVNLYAAHGPYLEGPGRWKLADEAFLDAERAPAWVRPYLAQSAGIAGVHLSNIRNGDLLSGSNRFITRDLKIPVADLVKLLSLYDAGVRAADFGLGQVLESWLAVHPQGIVVVASDHGEAFGEHGMMEHRLSVFPEVTNVPLVIAAPGRIPAGKRVSRPVKLEDLYGTLLTLVGVETQSDSLLELEPGGDGAVHAAAWPDANLAQRLGGSFAHTRRLFREGDYALLLSHGEVDGYFDVSNDPGMTRDLASVNRERVAAMRVRADEHFVVVEGKKGVTPVLDVPEETLERLREMGYLE